jgi:hypothetical protein
MVSRRRLGGAIVGSAAIGATWTTGLAILARGRHPHLYVVGRDTWHAVLIEHGNARALLLSGAFDVSPEPEINLLCGVLRQRIDVVIGDGSSLALLSGTFARRRAISTFVQLDSPPGSRTSPAYVPLAESLRLQIGAMHLDVQRIVSGAWSTASPGSSEWIGHLSLGEISIAIARSLEVVAELGSPLAMLAIAPSGDMEKLGANLPGVAIATNSGSVNAVEIGGYVRVGTWITRTFRRDIAEFIIRDREVQLPQWSRQVVDQPELGLVTTLSRDEQG